MKASIIIPSYNSKERLRLNLLSLNCQDYPNDDIEIIVIDNGSDDNTMEMLKGAKLKYPHKFIRIEKNLGIANGRNKGILSATGDLLIFHDSDMIAAKNFVASHIAAHTKKNMVVCGNFWKRVYSHFYDNFSADQISELRKKQRHDNYKNKAQLISDDDVNNGKFEHSSFDLEIDFTKSLKAIAIKEGNNLLNYSMPWRFFITNNLSVERKRVVEVGMFDANIVKYGYEDYDLGIRLYKSGSKFVLAPDIISVHQEHPKYFNYKDLAENLNYICNKFNDICHIDVILVCMGDCLGFGEDSINLIMGDIEKVLPLKKYNDFVKLFLELLQTICKMYFKQSFDSAIQMSGHITSNIPRLIEHCRELRDFHKANNLVDGVCFLLKKIFDIDLKMLIEM
ncbi:MAG: glycosyltransferase [Firmicutes bacterium]|nr:glycosyltransferase [Bacillota bacterium]